MYDLVNLYHDVLDAIPAPAVSVVGFGFGGWIAAELAVAGPGNSTGWCWWMPLASSSAAERTRDIVHFFNTDPSGAEPASLA